ncbi:TonB family protein [Longimonas halophila]|nr:TonB family protein [Longimonas halophila]
MSLSACGTDEPGLEETERGALAVGQVAVQTVEERTVAPAERTVALEGLRGALDLRAHSDDTAAWTFTKIARDRDSTRAQNVLEGLAIAERGSETRYTFDLQSDVPERSIINVSGTLPASTPLTVRRSSGAVHLHGLRSAIDIEQTHGDVHVEAAEGAVRVRLNNGDITVDWATLPSGIEADLETENGTIRITLPDTASTQLDVATTAGRVFSQGLAYTERALQASEAGYQFTGQLGTGAASIRARTTHGNIMLQARANDMRSDTSATAPTDLAAPDTLIERETLPADSDTTEASSAPAPASDSVYTEVDTEAAPVGGLETLTEAATYPDEAAANDITGRVYVQATVDADGTVRTAELVRGIGYGCDEEALRVVRNTSFEPGQRDGEPVASRITVWVQFGPEEASEQG